jgi:DNA-binding response OmpR family regulator
METDMKLLMVQDGFDLAGALGRSLVVRGCEVLCCADGDAAQAAAQGKHFDAMVLDLTLPELDGLGLLKRVRASGNRIPVLLITPRNDLVQRMAGLNAGADDCLTRPFDLDELMARLRALTRRLGPDGELRCGRLRCEPDSGIFFRDQMPINLSPRETSLLRRLMARVDHAVPQEALHDAVFGAGDATPAEAVEVLVHRLRQKLHGANVEILTLRGVGYLLCDEAAGNAPRSAAVH